MMVKTLAVLKEAKKENYARANSDRLEPWNHGLMEREAKKYALHLQKKFIEGMQRP